MTFESNYFLQRTSYYLPYKIVCCLLKNTNESRSIIVILVTVAYYCCYSYSSSVSFIASSFIFTTNALLLYISFYKEDWLRFPPIQREKWREKKKTQQQINRLSTRRVKSEWWMVMIFSISWMRLKFYLQPEIQLVFHLFFLQFFSKKFLHLLVFTFHFHFGIFIVIILPSIILISSLDPLINWPYTNGSAVY